MINLYRIKELRALEAAARASLPAGTLMQRAGDAAARWIDGWLRACGPRAPGSASVLLLCGPGDNGGDGFQCALTLQGLGHDCQCWAPLAGTSEDAGAARARWLKCGGRIVQTLPETLAFDLAVDALLGIGIGRPLADPFLAALRQVQQCGLPVIALDVPSGLDADTGAWQGAVAGAAALHTVTFLADKPGLHMLDGADAAGEIRVESLGIEEWAGTHGASGCLNGPAQFEALQRRRPRNSNKGDYGTVVVVGGAVGMVGAALLAARAALRLGAGKVLVECTGAPEMRVDPGQPELMLRAEAALPGASVLVAGCGMGTGDDAKSRLRVLVAHDGPAVFDADALNCLAQDPELVAALRTRTRGTVLTPHPGEAARLLGRSTREVQQDRIGTALQLAREHASVVVLKGVGTVIAEASGAYALNPTGGPALASAGTGDVLAGMIGALVAQGADCATAARAATWLHGHAADAGGADVGLTASELAPLAARALARLRSATPRIS